MDDLLKLFERYSARETGLMIWRGGLTPGFGVWDRKDAKWVHDGYGSAIEAEKLADRLNMLYQQFRTATGAFRDDWGPANTDDAGRGRDRLAADGDRRPAVD